MGDAADAQEAPYRAGRTDRRGRHRTALQAFAEFSTASLRDEVRSIVERTTRSQGVPRYVDNDLTLRTIASIAARRSPSGRGRRPRTRS